MKKTIFDNMYNVAPLISFCALAFMGLAEGFGCPFGRCLTHKGGENKPEKSITCCQLSMKELKTKLRRMTR
jgi:hypothetical protein